MKVSNIKCRSFVQANKEFQGSNLYGILENNNYVVYSYGRHFPLFACINGEWYENKDRYSVTTSKHRTQAHPMVDTIKVSTNELKQII